MNVGVVRLTCWANEEAGGVRPSGETLPAQFADQLAYSRPVTPQSGLCFVVADGGLWMRRYSFTTAKRKQTVGCQSRTESALTHQSLSNLPGLLNRYAEARSRQGKNNNCSI